MLNKRNVNHLEDGKQSTWFLKRTHRIFSVIMSVGTYSIRFISWLLSETSWVTERKCGLSDLLCDLLENINYLGEDEVFLFFYILSCKSIVLVLTLHDFLPCTMWLHVCIRRWFQAKSLDGANNSLVNF